MNIAKLLLPLGLGGLLLLGSCDKVDDPKAENIVPGPGPSGQVVRNILLEDCTGQRCNNCPQAAEIATALHGIYGDRLVTVAIHMSDAFAPPLLPLGDGYYDADFRTPAGNEYETNFQLDALPCGMINRIVRNGRYRILRGAWSDVVTELMGQTTAADMALTFQNTAYSSGTNRVSGSVKLDLVRNVDAALALTLYLTESHIIDWQRDSRLPQPQDIPNYEHNHVLRGALNGTWGQALDMATVTVGDSLDVPFNYALPSNVLVPANCHLVAYVYRTDTREVLQVTQVDL